MYPFTEYVVCDRYGVVIFMEEYDDAMFTFARCCFGGSILEIIGTSCCENCMVGFLRYCLEYYLVPGICLTIDFRDICRI